MSRHSLLAVVFVSAIGGAEAAPGSEVQAELLALLEHRDHFVAMSSPDAAIILDDTREAVIGADGKVRTFAPGTLERLIRSSMAGPGLSASTGEHGAETITVDPSKVDFGALLGIGPATHPDLPKQFMEMLKAGIDYRMKRDDVGFLGRRWTKETRPLEIAGATYKLKIAPDGSAHIKQKMRGRELGFRRSSQREPTHMSRPLIEPMRAVPPRIMPRFR